MLYYIDVGGVLCGGWVFDLCIGMGIVVLYVVILCDEVVVIDIDLVVLEFVMINRWLNGCDGCLEVCDEWLEIMLVWGEWFDLLICNLFFVVFLLGLDGIVFV